jgi:hypothetical protein
MRNRKLCDGPRDSIFHQIFGSGRVTEALEGCARLFQPMYAEANMGHPSRTLGSGYEIQSQGFPPPIQFGQSDGYSVLSASTGSTVAARREGK